MEDQNQLLSASQLITSSPAIIIAIPSDPDQDMVSAAVSLYLSLKAAGKNIQIGCGSPVVVDDSLSGLREIPDSVGARNLMISFDYHEDDLEKVDYDVRPDGKFYLMIKPKANSPVPSVGNVKYSYSGASADLVITLGINSLEELGKLYADEKNFFDQAKILSLNITPKPAQFTPNTLHQMTQSFAELVTLLLEKSGLKPTSDAAMNLLKAIYTATKDLTSPRMSADTFGAISFLMRHGARLPNQMAFTPRFSQPAFFEAPTAPLSPVSFAPAEEEIPLPPEEASPADYSSVPSDWTKPKIFRASDI